MRKPVLAVAFLFLFGAAEALSQTPVISLSPSSFSFSAFQSGSLPFSQNLQITNAGGGTLNWSVSKKRNSSWLSATPVTGTAPSTVTVSITTTGLVPNIYVDTLVIYSAAASPTTAYALVTYTVSAPPQPALISLSPTSFTFSANQSGPLPLSQNLQLTNAGTGTLNWSVYRARNSVWLSAGPANGTAPSTITVSITTTGLVPNTYYDTLVISSANASNSPQRVPVTYTVSPPPQPAVISLSPASFNFSAFQSGSLPLSQNLQITNAGSGTLNWTVARARNSAWLSAGPASGTAPSTVTVSITTTGLAPNIYYDTLVISSANASNSPQRVPVTYTVSPPPQPAVISLSPSFFSFSAFQSGSLPLSQNLQITNAGSGTLNWTVSKKHNATWLSAGPANGTAPSTVIVSITTTGLVPNTYVDTLVISSGEANNSPQQVPVTYTVSSPPQPAEIAVSPASFEFGAIQSGPVPFAQELQIDNAGGGALNWSIAKARNSVWLSATPGNGTVPSTVNVTITTTGLVPNTYYDTLVITSEDAGNSPVRVPVNYTVFPVPSIVAAPESLNFTATEGDANPSPQLVFISVSDASIAWTISKSQAWLGVSPAADTGNGQASVSVNLTGLVEGDYFDTVVVTAPAASNSPRHVPVHLHLNGPVLSPASLLISPGQMDFNAQQNQSIPPQFIDISNGGQLPLNWTATILHGASWLSISPDSGTNDGSITVSVTTDLEPMTYVDTIKIEAAGALNSPRKIPVRLNVATDVGDEPGNRPRSFKLSQNYPNPFNPTTKIDFALPRSGYATLEVFNVVGQRIRVLVDGELPAGPHSVVWDGRSSSGQVVGSGIYFYRLKSQNFSDIKRMVLLK